MLYCPIFHMSLLEMDSAVMYKPDVGMPGFSINGKQAGGILKAINKITLLNAGLFY